MGRYRPLSPAWRKACLGTDLLSDFWRGETVTFPYFFQVRQTLRLQLAGTLCGHDRGPSLVPGQEQGQHWKVLGNQGSHGPHGLGLVPEATWLNSAPFSRSGEVRPLSWGGCACGCVRAPALHHTLTSSSPGASTHPFSGSETPKLEGLGQ